MAARSFGGSPFGSDQFQGDQLARRLPYVLSVLVLVVLAWMSVYTLGPHERAVVLRFGKRLTTKGPGLHFMIPFVDRAVRLSMAEHRIRLPVSRDAADDRPQGFFRTDLPPEQEALELTGDLNAAVVEWTVQWQVEDPMQYLFAVNEQHIETLLEVVAKSVMHRLVGDYSMDEILTSKREEVGAEARDATQKVLAGYNLGVRVTGLQMQRVTPPDQVKPAFDDVNAAIQRRDKLVNEANKERNKLMPQAEAKADKLINEARGYADRRRAEARGEISALMAKYRAYLEAPDITRQRLYLEAMEEVLAASGPKTVIDADLKGLVPLLQLDSDNSDGSSANRKEGK